MKVILLLISVLLSGFIHADVQQDVVFKSRFDLESSEAFIKQLRIFLSNNNFGDPYSQELKKPIKVDLAQAMDKIPEDTQKWIRDFQSVLKMQLFESNFNLIVERFSYKVTEFNSDFQPGKPNPQRAEYVTISYVKGLHLQAEKIIFQVELKQTQSKEPLKFNIELLKPEFYVNPETMAELSLGWTTAILPENIALTLEVVDIRQIMAKIIERPDLINFTTNDIRIPDVSIKIGHKVVRFDQVKIKKFLEDRKEEMKLGVLDILNINMKENFSNLLRGTPKELILPRTFSFAGDVPGVIDVQKMTVNKTGITQIDFDGHFCENPSALLEKTCPAGVIPTKVRRKISDAQYQKSLREMNRNLIEEKKNVTVSISEHYLNQLVDATIRAGLWEEALKGFDFVLGPEKAFILAEEDGDSFNLYLDIIQPLYGMRRVMVGRSELRFPVRLKIAVNVETIEQIPHFTIKVKEIATDAKLILEGLLSCGLPTTVNTVPRFRSKVVNEILSEVRLMDKKLLIDFELPELKGTYLDDLNFSSDGQGRGSATIRFRK